MIQRPVNRRWALLPCLLLLAACDHFAPAPLTMTAPPVESTNPTPQPDLAGVHNLVLASQGIYSGSEPHGEEGFASLAELGIRTVVSVDGARPNIELAHKYGLQYVHIPIGYDGIGVHASQILARAARDCPRPIYVHCHHGQHRGPAAAAVLGRAAGEVDQGHARRILEVAGTGIQYPGLWRDVERYVPPENAVELPELVEVAQVESFAAAMAKIDRNFDNLKLCQQSNWSAVAEHPDIVAAQEAVILREGLHEATRNLAQDRSEDFRAWLSETEAHAARLEEAIRLDDSRAATAAFRQLEACCSQCHRKYRN
jgi:protein tyrosine phosphatase (PTP) superfamily phosphohydrolase (DUF442 family)/cytochrome c556